MSQTRPSFLQTSAATGALLALPPTRVSGRCLGFRSEPRLRMLRDSSVGMRVKNRDEILTTTG
jgi:hypothetical protein